MSPNDSTLTPTILPKPWQLADEKIKRFFKPGSKIIVGRTNGEDEKPYYVLERDEAGLLVSTSQLDTSQAIFLTWSHIRYVRWAK